MSTRVIVVDDDDIIRRGSGEVLADHPDIEVTALLTHKEALQWSDWSLPDVVIVDAADERESTDQFPGVGVVERIRRGDGDRQPLIVVITGHFFDDAVRRRMREARADFFYHRSEVQDAGALHAAVLQSGVGRDGGVPEPRDPEAQFRLGVTATTRVNEGVTTALTLGLHAPAGKDRSRARSRLRQTFNLGTRLHPVNRDGTTPDREQGEPSFVQIQRFLQWATKTKGDSKRD